MRGGMPCWCVWGMCVLIMVLFSDCYESQVALCGSLRLVGPHNGGVV